MLTQAPPASSQYVRDSQQNDGRDLSGQIHRQVIGYLGLALPILLVQLARLRPNTASDQWTGDSISAYYWSGAVALFVGLLAALSLFLLTYRGYNNELNRYDRAAGIVAGAAAAFVALFPTTPPAGIVLPWWRDWIGVTHFAAAVILFSTFAFFSLFLFPRNRSQPLDAEKKAQNAIYLVCGIGIVVCMGWAVIAKLGDRSIYWPESFALGFFAWSWLVKGKALASITTTIKKSKDRMAS